MKLHDRPSASSPERPLVTFALFAYNQENHIREAIEGAFAQTYESLEIILSDDCSPDRTFEVMEEMAAEYQGPHRVVLNRNPTNLGIGGHVNRIMELCRTDFVVVAAGDDISMPARTENLVQAWLNSNKRITLVHSMALCMDTSSTDLGTCRQGGMAEENPTVEDFLRQEQSVLGATNAWDRELFSFFGPLLPGVRHEDNIVALRSLLIGEIRFLPSPLVRYRVDSGIMQAVRQEIARAPGRQRPPAAIEGRYRTYLQMCRDISLAGGNPAAVRLLRHRRARCLLTYRLAKKRRISRARFHFFWRRVSPPILFWEILRYRAPKLFSAVDRLRRRS